MLIHVRYFAALREVAGRDRESLDFDDGSTVAQAQAELANRYPQFAALLPRCVAAVNRSYVTPEHLLRAGDELAFIPPLGGGSTWHRSSR